jgi:hypothetical protein
MGTAGVNPLLSDLEKKIHWKKINMKTNSQEENVAYRFVTF